MKTPEEIKTKILTGLYRSKDGLSINETTELLNQLMEAVKQANSPGAIQGLIERVEDKLTIENPVGVYYDGYNAAVKDAIEMIRATPCIERECEWDSNLQTTQCNNKMLELYDNSIYPYCPFCGRKIKRI